MCRVSGVEPFDEDLSRRLQVLNDQANTLTTEVIAFRKALPARRAEAMERRAAVIRALEAKKEDHRRAAEKEYALQLREQSKPINIDLKRKAEVADTLKHSVVDVTSLQVVSILLTLPQHRTVVVKCSMLTLDATDMCTLILPTVNFGASDGSYRTGETCQASKDDALVTFAPDLLQTLLSILRDCARLYPYQCNG